MGHRLGLARYLDSRREIASGLNAGAVGGPVVWCASPGGKVAVAAGRAQALSIDIYPTGRQLGKAVF
jgi:hypothetical protein